MSLHAQLAHCGSVNPLIDKGLATAARACSITEVPADRACDYNNRER